MLRTIPSALNNTTVKLAGVIGAMGIVFGDIATSPLYTLQECLAGAHGVAPEPANVLGCISLIVWSLLLVVTVKYVAVLMQADNRGEGGTSRSWLSSPFASGSARRACCL